MRTDPARSASQPWSDAPWPGWGLRRLEERIVLDAAPYTAPEVAESGGEDPVPDPGDGSDPTGDEAAPTAVEDAGPQSDAAGEAAGVSVPSDASVLPDGASPLPEPGAEFEPSPQTRVLMVAEGLGAGDALAEAAADGVLVLRVNDSDSPAEILGRLEGLLEGAEAGSIALATHGENGSFALSEAVSVDEAALAEAWLGAFWSALGDTVADGGRIDLLGCDIAGSPAGDALVEALESLAGVDVAASDDATGNPDAGGDWFLETEGVDVAAAYFDPEPLRAIEGHLGVFTVTTAGTTGADGTIAASLATDTTDGDGLSLAEAVHWANQSPDAQSTIRFDSGVGDAIVFDAAFADANSPDTDGFGPIALPAIDGTNKTITIEGGGRSLTRGGSAFRFFYVEDQSTLALRDITLTGGLALGGEGGDGWAGGGGGAGMGGAIFNAGTLNLDGVSFSGNEARGGDGGDSTGPVGGSGGGGMGANGQNNAGNNGGAGGGLHGGAGGFSTTNGGEAGGVGGGGGGGFFGVSPGSTGGNGGFGGGGGGMSSNNAVDVTGFGGFGGGGAGSNGDTPTPYGGFGGGRGSAGGGTANRHAGGGAGMGGAIFNYDGTIHITNSTFYDNTATGGTDGAGGNSTAGDAYGGAIFNFEGDLHITHATFSGNTVSTGASATDDGGALFVYNGDGAFGPAAATNPGGFPDAPGAPTVVLRNSILANSVGGVDAAGVGTITTNDLNSSWIEAGSGSLVSTQNGDPDLGAFADHGGPADTIALAATSGAIDAGDASFASDVDQRNVIRDSAPDLGAYEFSSAPVLQSTTANLASIPEDSLNPPGNAITTLVDANHLNVYDFANDPIGLAVTEVDNTNGQWQYRDASAAWLDLGAAGGLRDLGANDQLLPSASALRFVPNADWFGEATVRARAWDGTQGVGYGTFDVVNVGRQTAFSLDLATLTIPVTDVAEPTPDSGPPPPQTDPVAPPPPPPDGDAGVPPPPNGPGGGLGPLDGGPGTGDGPGEPVQFISDGGGDGGASYGDGAGLDGGAFGEGFTWQDGGSSDNGPQQPAAPGNGDSNAPTEPGTPGNPPGVGDIPGREAAQNQGPDASAPGDAPPPPGAPGDGPGAPSSPTGPGSQGDANGLNQGPPTDAPANALREAADSALNTASTQSDGDATTSGNQAGATVAQDTDNASGNAQGLDGLDEDMEEALGNDPRDPFAGAARFLSAHDASFDTLLGHALDGGEFRGAFQGILRHQAEAAEQFPPHLVHAFQSVAWSASAWRAAEQVTAEFEQDLASLGPLESPLRPRLERMLNEVRGEQTALRGSLSRLQRALETTAEYGADRFGRDETVSSLRELQSRNDTLTTRVEALRAIQDALRATEAGEGELAPEQLEQLEAEATRQAEARLRERAERWDRASQEMVTMRMRALLAEPAP